MGGVNFQKTDDAVERGADVVAHAGEEVGFGGVGPVGLLHGGAKLAVFLLKLPGVLLLGGQLLFPVALDGPQAETVDGADSNEVKHQSKNHGTGHIVKHIVLRCKIVNIKIATRAHEPEVPGGAILLYALQVGIRLHGTPITGLLTELL